MVLQWELLSLSQWHSSINIKTVATEKGYLQSLSVKNDYFHYAPPWSKLAKYLFCLGKFKKKRDKKARSTHCRSPTLSRCPVLISSCLTPLLIKMPINHSSFCESTRGWEGREFEHEEKMKQDHWERNINSQEFSTETRSSEDIDSTTPKIPHVKQTVIVNNWWICPGRQSPWKTSHPTSQKVHKSRSNPTGPAWGCPLKLFIHYPYIYLFHCCYLNSSAAHLQKNHIHQVIGILQTVSYSDTNKSKFFLGRFRESAPLKLPSKIEKEIFTQLQTHFHTATHFHFFPNQRESKVNDAQGTEATGPQGKLPQVKHFPCSRIFFSWYFPTIFFVTQQTPQLRAGDPQAYQQEVLVAACVKLCHVFSITF